jgi:hypothetical protein
VPSPAAASAAALGLRQSEDLVLAENPRTGTAVTDHHHLVLQQARVAVASARGRELPGEPSRPETALPSEDLEDLKVTATQGKSESGFAANSYRGLPWLVFCSV